jgi:hypothetical protein
MSNLVPNSTLTLTVDLWDIAPYLSGGRENARGVDLGLQYQIETGFGIFTWLTRVSYLDSFVYQFPGSIAREVAGRANNGPFEGSFFGDVTSGDAWVKWKGITNLDWTWHNIDFNVTLHMYDGFWEQIKAKQFDGIWKQHWVHPTWFTDAQLSYSLIFTPPVEAAPVPGYSKRGNFLESNKTNAYRSENGSTVGKDSSLAEPESRVVRDNTRTSNRQNRTMSLIYIPAASESLKLSDLCPSKLLMDFLSRALV